MKEKEILIQKEKEIAEKIKAISIKDGYTPVIDGIIDIERYLLAKYKILWILKEANYGENEVNNAKPGEFSNLLHYYRNASETEINKSLTTRRVKLVSQRILSDLSKLEAFRSIAYINIKKIAGNRNSDNNELHKAFEENKDLLFDQINTYSPQIIICGNTLQYFEELGFRNCEEKEPIGMGERNYFITKERIYINAYHPSYPDITDNEYCNKIFNAFTKWVSKQ